MDFSEKDAARSKWKLAQRNRRGRGGRGAPSARGGRHQSNLRDLGSNEDRYLDEEVDEHAGPVRKSLGADLAQLLESADAYDAGFYHRSRANLLEEYGLPSSDAASYQGLSFDLKGLAACLSLLPRNALLGTHAFDEEEEGQEEQKGAGLDVLRDASHSRGGGGRQQHKPPNGAPAVQSSVSPQAPAAQTAGAASASPSASPAAAAPLLPGGTAPPAAYSPLGANPTAAAAATRPTLAGGMQPCAAPAAASKAHLAAATAAAPALGATCNRGAGPSQPPAPPGAVGEQADDGLDFLLGLMDIAPPQQVQQAQQAPSSSQQQQRRGGLLSASAAPAAPPQQQAQQQAEGPSASGGVTRIAWQAPQAQPQEQSLDDWLDAL